MVKKRVNGKSIYVEKGDAIIGKILTKSNKNGEEELIDCSYVIKSGEEGFIDRVLETTTASGYKMIKVTIRNPRIPEIGDKFASRSAQKGTCIVENSLVTLSNGTSVKIKDIKINDTVWGWNGKGLQTAKCTNKQYMGEKETLVITLGHGREITCTPDHRILTKDGWKEAVDLTLKDRIVANLAAPLDRKDSYENKWSLPMTCDVNGIINKIKLNMETDVDRQRTLAFARVLGYVSVNTQLSYKNDTYTISTLLRSLIDINLFIADINLINFDLDAFGENVEKKGNSWVTLPNMLTNFILSVSNITQKYCKPTLPKFLEYAPVSVVREYLGGMFGAIGHAPHLSQGKMKRVSLSMIVSEPNAEDMNEYFDKVQAMLNVLKVKSTITKPKIIKSKTNGIDKLIEYNLKVYNFFNIGFRYNVYKQSKLSIGTAYWQTKLHTNNFINVSEWLNMTDGMKFFVKHESDNDSEGKYCMDYNDSEVPYYYMPIAKIESAGVRSVYDITVDGLESFIANGLIVHNCGMIYPHEDMPFTQDGVVPDIIINSHCIPSRMTVSQLLETTLGKSCVMEGTFGDATPFSSNSVNVAEELCDRLQKNGFQGQGWEVMYNGFTGEPMNARIFIGPCYYQRLKHMVSDKLHSRSQGHVTTLTRQPLEGRSREGGLRFGEMERDCMITHGVSQFLKERLFLCSDPFVINICQRCHQIATTPTECKACDTDKVVKVSCPFASKLLYQELNAMQIKTCFKVKDVFNEM